MTRGLQLRVSRPAARARLTTQCSPSAQRASRPPLTPPPPNRDGSPGVPRQPGHPLAAHRIQAAGHGAGGDGQGERRNGHSGVSPCSRLPLPPALPARQAGVFLPLSAQQLAGYFLPQGCRECSRQWLCCSPLCRCSGAAGTHPWPLCPHACACRYEGEVFKIQSASNNSWVPHASITGKRPPAPAAGLGRTAQAGPLTGSRHAASAAFAPQPAALPPGGH